ncbi:hypothetical protein PTKU64_91790 (plasmid) [Paraburkholderia terrae]|uniref:Uncharacterized protein n=1 Tax=Paraburkholderia terrae TaxID=311230 RepID=A0ABN6JX54_9BURK|nr:hypothetical protein [Paraburkholderia terrae]BCZ85504.1 hypothetical protein PTKU64_91790 [Paraburkholderia terrae]
MQNRDNGLMVVILIPCILALAVIVWVSRAIGASFASVCTTATSLVVVIVALTILWRFLDDFGLQILAAFPALGWPTIWPVLTSIANGGNDSESSFRPWHEQSFIDSAWMTWGLEVIFVALLCFAVFHEYRRRRYW